VVKHVNELPQQFASEGDGRAGLSPATSIGISIAFWLTLGLSVAMFAPLTLAPRIVERARLAQRFLENQVEEARLKREVDHFTAVATALETDPDFVARVAGTELESVPAGGLTIRVDDRLGYDARVPQRAVRMETPPLPWYVPFFESLAEPSPLRRHWTLATVGLVAVAFLFLNDGFFSGSLGTWLLSLLETVKRRYIPRGQE
jgi:hypothetical protein